MERFNKEPLAYSMIMSIRLAITSLLLISTAWVQMPPKELLLLSAVMGSKAWGVQGSVLFSRNVLVPELVNGKRDPDPEHRIKGTFQAITGGWNDILLAIDLPQRFQATSLTPTLAFR